MKEIFINFFIFHKLITSIEKGENMSKKKQKDKKKKEIYKGYNQNQQSNGSSLSYGSEKYQNNSNAQE